jgi:hypothetical protein
MTIDRRLLALLQAEPGKVDELAAFLEQGRALAAEEEGTVTWYAFKISDTTYGIFDTFAGEEGRRAHLNGPIPAALSQVPEPHLHLQQCDDRCVGHLAHSPDPEHWTWTLTAAPPSESPAWSCTGWYQATASYAGPAPLPSSSTPKEPKPRSGRSAWKRTTTRPSLLRTSRRSQPPRNCHRAEPTRVGGVASSRRDGRRVTRPRRGRTVCWSRVGCRAASPGPPARTPRPASTAPGPACHGA